MATRGGWVIGGKVYPVEGMTIENFIDTPSLHLSDMHLNGGDYRHRNLPHDWVRQFVIHTTKGEDPQQFLDGVGPPLAADSVLEYWQRDPEHSGAHAVFDGDSGICCADLLLDAAYHATTVNMHSVGVEMYQEHGGVIRKATITNTVRSVTVAMLALNLPLQMVSDTYHEGKIIERLKDGGPDFVGLFGHRDQAWKFPYQLPPAIRAKYPDGYANRGRGDPGDEVYAAFQRAGFERFSCEGREDRAAWRKRQTALNKLGAHLVVDGIAGPGTMRALKSAGFPSGRDLDAAVGIVV